MDGKSKRRTDVNKRGFFDDWENPFWLLVDFLLEHPVIRVLVTLILSVSAGVATTVLLVILRTAERIP